MFDGDLGHSAVSDTTVTRAVVASVQEGAVRRGERAALVDGGRELAFSTFAAVVPAAAAGLGRHGVLPGDVGAIHLSGVCDLALALHAVTAVGAVPAPLPRGAPVDELSRMMSESGARFLLTGGAQAAASLAAVERSYVRQVFAFGDLPGATPFARLVEGGPARPPEPGHTVDPLNDLALRLWEPPAEITHADRLADLYRLGGLAGIGEGDVLACAPGDCSPLTAIGLMDLCLTQGATFVGVADSGVPALLESVRAHGATMAVVTPDALRALAYDHPALDGPRVRLLVTGVPDPEVVQACRTRHGWTVAALI
ncbi:AMP-binding protein [Spirillospora sp. CA-294931]|uniref:AMP-binding protein n=1 Tax=Spirillospora sp. CA-294931 TaxID=3240042 RepID=UPI003D8D22E4